MLTVPLADPQPVLRVGVASAVAAAAERRGGRVGWFNGRAGLHCCRACVSTGPKIDVTASKALKSSSTIKPAPLRTGPGARAPGCDNQQQKAAILWQ